MTSANIKTCEYKWVYGSLFN